MRIIKDNNLSEVINLNIIFEDNILNASYLHLFLIVLLINFTTMKTKVLVSYFLRKSMAKKNGQVPIYCKVRYNGDTAQFCTKIYVNYNCWDSRTTRVIGNNKKETNITLEQIRADIFNKYENLIKTDVVITAKTIVDYYKNESLLMNSIINVFEHNNSYMNSLIGKTYKKGSVKNFHTTLKHIKYFIKKAYNTNDLLLSKINSVFISEFSQFLLTQTKCNHNGMMKNMQRLKKVINQCIVNNWISNNPFHGFRMNFKRSNREFLLQNELQKLHNVKLSETLDRIRDIFLFSCYTGLSYTDICKFNRKHIKKGNDGLFWIYITRDKTNIPSNIPLLPPAVKLIRKHINSNYTGKIFAVISNQKTNMHLHTISDLCGFNKKLTFHSARHTFATTVTLSNGVPIETVSKMLGHNNIKTTQIYARVLDSKVSADMMILRQKFI